MTINELQCICYKDYANGVNTIVQVSGPMYSWEMREGVTGTGHRMIMHLGHLVGMSATRRHYTSIVASLPRLSLGFYEHLSLLTTAKFSLIQSVPVAAISNLTLYQKDNLQVINQWTCCWKLLNTVLTTMGCHTMKCLFSILLLVNKNILCFRLDTVNFGASLSSLARIIKCAVR